MVSDPFGSDHLPVVLALESVVSAVPKPTSRVNTRELYWSAFHERLEADTYVIFIPKPGGRGYRPI